MKPSPWGRAAEPEARLQDGLLALGLTLSPERIQMLLRYVQELVHWNAAYNLTAVRDPAEMVTRHLLDTLVLVPHLGDAVSLLDVGSGAGVPGLILAIAQPQLAVTVLDSNGKKARFLRHAVRALGLAAVSVVEQRVEQWQTDIRFDRVISRAVAALQPLVEATRPLPAEHGRWLAMKGRVDAAELESLPHWVEVLRIVPLEVPGLEEARHLVELIRRRV